MKENIWVRVLIGLMIWLIGIIILTPIAKHGKNFSDFKLLMLLGTLTILAVCYFRLTGKKK